MAKDTDKGDVKSKRARVGKVVSKRWQKLKLIWINYGQLVMDCFDCIVISKNDWACLIAIPIFPLVSWFVYFLHHLLQEYKKQKT